MSKASQYLDAVISAVSAQRKENSLTVSDERIEKALCYSEALKTINVGEATATQARLIAMWYLYQNVEKVGEYNEFTDFIEQEVLVTAGVDTDMVRRSAAIVSNILQWIHTNPVKDNDTTITVESILDKPGLWGKMREGVGAFIKADDVNKAKLIISLFNDTLEAFRDKKKEIQLASMGISDGDDGNSGSNGDGGDGSQKSTMTRVTVGMKRLPNDKVQFTFPQVDSTMAASIEMFLQNLCRFESVE